jgi:phosphotransacetylase
VAGMYIVLTKKGPLFFADCTVNVNPTAEDLMEITVLTAKAVQQLNIQPRIAMLSYSNFGSTKGKEPETVAQAVAMLKVKFDFLRCTTKYCCFIYYFLFLSYIALILRQLFFQIEVTAF